MKSECATARTGKPRTRNDAEPGTRNPEPEPGTCARVLVVDDERSMRELLSIVLRREGYDVTVAENGADGDGSARSRPDSIC